VQYAASLGLLDGPAYAIHVNYLEPGDLDVLAQLRPTVVFCPRSHSYFGHPRHPIEQLLAAGVRVALGTDSLASNDHLSPLREAALVRRDYPAVPAATVFDAITGAALAPLGWDHQLGRLVPGCRADLTVFPVDGDPGRDFADVFDAVIEQGRSALTMCEGAIVHSDSEYRRHGAVAAVLDRQG
jgi:cytosine/adenosine deaminase-related metal-dependent hydrolase